MVVYKGKNKEHCDEVIKNIVDNWDELVNSKQEKNKNEKWYFGNRNEID